MTKKPTPKKKAVKKKGKYYIDRKELMVEIKACKANDNIMSDCLAKMLQLLTKKYASSSKYSGYTYNDDMQSYALMMLVRTWASFNPEKSNNPFGFYTQCIKHSFYQFLNQEKKHRNIRDEIMVRHGLTPSLTYQLEHAAASHKNDDEEDHHQSVTDATESQTDI